MRRKRADLAVVHHGRGLVLPQNAGIQDGTVSDIDGYQHHACAPEPVHENQATPIVGRQKGDACARSNANVLNFCSDPMGHRYRLLVAHGHAALLDEYGVRRPQARLVQRVYRPHILLLIFSPSIRARW